MKTYDTIIFDLDGTAIVSEESATPSESLIEIVEKAQSKMNLCAATGRGLTYARHVLKALNLTDPCVISAGTQVVNPKTEEILWEEPMNLDDINKVIEACKSYPYRIIIEDEGLEGGKVANEIKLMKPVNVMYVMEVSKKDSKLLSKALESIEGIIASPVGSWGFSGFDIHITSQRATKEHAINELLKMVDTTKEKTIGVGDADNDIHLFKAVGLKVAMGNATDNLKKEADIITETVENDGLVKIIEKYL